VVIDDLQAVAAGTIVGFHDPAARRAGQPADAIGIGMVRQHGDAVQGEMIGGARFRSGDAAGLGIAAEQQPARCFDTVDQRRQHAAGFRGHAR
jgi:hypothetical protein